MSRPGDQDEHRAASEYTVEIHNRLQLMLAYGADAVAVLQRVIRERVARFAEDLDVELPSQSREASSQDTPESTVALRGGPGFARDVLLRRLLSRPAMLGGKPVHVLPELVAQSCASAATDLFPASGTPISGALAEAAARYRADMALAAELFAMMARDELVLATQPIRNRAGETLYEECLLRHARQEASGRDNVVRSLAPAIDALERLGLVRGLDHFVLQRAIAALAEQPDLRLGVNISAQSAMLDGWWDTILDRLADRGLAGRLTIEITETSLLPSLPAAVAFTARLRELGCRIALDDFGAGREAIRNLWGLRPDIVKIDAFFLHQACLSPQGLAALRGLVGLSAALADTLVIEGVESEADAALARQIGVTWLQGFHIAAPARRDHFVLPETRPVFGRRSRRSSPSGPDERRPFSMQLTPSLETKPAVWRLLASLALLLTGLGAAGHLLGSHLL